MGVRKEQKEARRNEILAAGLDLFIRRGYSSTKINDIAKYVGMSTGLLFHYFESKEKLYEELIRNGIAGPMSIMDDSGMEPIAFFEAAAKQIFDTVKSRPISAKYFVLMNHALYNEAAPQSVKNMLKDYDIYTPTSQLIIKGQEKGMIRKGNPYALAMAYWSAIQGVAEQIAVNPEYPCPESEWIVDILREPGLRLIE
jgi:AcrR family transcriptional regulator